ncbi:MAG: hypothetical protein KDJ39_06060 [Gammaproteobacteria bacterium]|nr:hypothetical protein [Gammaproteobacteria bacterium]
MITAAAIEYRKKAALQDAADDLLAFTEKMHRYLIGERDCFYERHTNSEGEFTDPDDEEACLMMDRDIDEAATLIARAKGIA